MTPAIICWSRPDVDISALARMAEGVLGYNPVKAAEKHATLSPMAKVIAILAAFKDKSVKDGLKAVREAESVLRHLTYGFEIAATMEVMFEITQCTDLAVTANRSINGCIGAIVSGNLEQWDRAIRELNCADGEYGTRYIFSWILIFFEREGLGDIWYDQKKVLLKDQTLHLEDRRK